MYVVKFCQCNASLISGALDVAKRLIERAAARQKDKEREGEREGDGGTRIETSKLLEF